MEFAAKIEESSISAHLKIHGIPFTRIIEEHPATPRHQTKQTDKIFDIQ
jgi:hypothetical protein